MQSIEERAKSLSISTTNKFGVQDAGKIRGNKTLNNNTTNTINNNNLPSSPNKKQ